MFFHQALDFAFVSWFKGRLWVEQVHISTSRHQGLENWIKYSSCWYMKHHGRCEFTFEIDRQWAVAMHIDRGGAGSAFLKQTNNQVT